MPHSKIIAPETCVWDAFTSLLGHEATVMQKTIPCYCLPHSKKTNNLDLRYSSLKYVKTRTWKPSEICTKQGGRWRAEQQVS